MPGLTSVTRADGNLEFLNQNYLEYLGDSPETVRTLRWDFAVHPEDAFLRTLLHDQAGWNGNWSVCQSIHS
jgi:PAS domain-containing protein